MKTEIISLTLGLLAVIAAAQPEQQVVVEPVWRLVTQPSDWPTEPDGSNQLVRCVVAVQSEVEKAQAFLASGSYQIVQGGPKGHAPHVTTKHPDNPRTEWTVFFNPDTQQIGQIVRRNPQGVQRVTMHHDGMKLSSASLGNRVLRCFTNGLPHRFAVRVVDDRWYQVTWNRDGTVSEERLIDWSKRGKPIKR